MRIDFNDYSIDFGSGNGGFPFRILQHLRNERTEEIVHTEAPWLSVRLADGRTAVPKTEEEPLVRYDDDGSVHVQYCNVLFYADGERLYDWRLGLDYEFLESGNCFVQATFQALEQYKPALDAFTLDIPMDFGPENDVTYGYWPRPNWVDPTGIAHVEKFIRNLTEKKNLSVDCIMPLAAFDFGRPGRPSRHIEWLMEDQMSLDDGFHNVRTELIWKDAGPELRYEFVAKRIQPKPNPYYWREKIGFNLGQTPKIRDKAPLRVYHCIDAFENIPTLDRVRQMAAEGTDVLALHDACWRSDIRNGGNPYDQRKFIEMVEECHRHDIRVAPYFRGGEESARDDACDWFKYYLKKDYDGLYSDYGAAFCFHEVNEACAAGRIGFEQHYRCFEAVRKDTIGKDGVLIVHTGPFLSSAVISSMVDGYLSGEGERGAMLRSRRENAYFSAATVAPGALWTAEFPEYRSDDMLPFLANLGQYPHQIIGEQRKSASVAHPMEPGNVIFSRPLWKLYGLMKDERNIRFDNDLCDERIECDSYDTGLSVFTMNDGSKLYLLSNFSKEERFCETNAILNCTWKQKCYRLEADGKGTRLIALEAGEKVGTTLRGKGICGFLVCSINEKWAGRLWEFAKPYPEPAPAARAYEQKLRDAVEQRYNPSPAKTIYMKADAPYYPGALEISFLKECYENVYELSAVDEKGNSRRLGYLSKLGLTRELPPVSECLWPGQETDWIPLHECLQKGRHRLEVRCTSFDGAPRTQRYHITLSENKDERNGRDVTFYLALDSDKSCLSFDVEKG